MQMGMSLSQEMRMTQEQRLEQTLEQKLECQLALKITLEQHLERENIVNELIRFADENETWTKFDKDGFNFTFAKVPYKLAKQVADEYGFGFAHCRYKPFEAMIFGEKIALARGDWTLFVVEDKVPRELIDFVALHERGEQLSAGDHFFASQLEFAYSGKRKAVRDYIKFIDSEAPTKFVDLTEARLHPLPDELVELLKTQDFDRRKEELEIAKIIIDNSRLPKTVLLKMHNYETATERICEALNESIGPTQAKVHEALLPPYTEENIKRAASSINNCLKKALTAVSYKNARGVSPHRVNEAFYNYRNLVLGEVREARLGKIELPTSFYEALELAMNRESLAKII